MSYKVKSRLWGIVNHTLFRWTPFFMRRTRVMMLKVCGADIAWNCSVNSRATIIDPWNLTMRSLSSIDEDCCIRCRGHVTIGEKTCISRGVDLLSGSHDITSPNFEMKTAPIVIGDNVWIATKALVSMGVTIGEGAVIGAKACVFKDVEPWTVVGGNPAKFIKKRVIEDD
ncbi:MAG: putative colanic acid biosynthesis acetyltransferase [Bacteroidaceae bacterium]|nr:putative colanic acid biosynthesis acetyltransferase [Bacteroidaceae bacterium]